MSDANDEIAALQARLDKARAERAATEAKRSESARVGALRAKVEEEERAARDAEAIARAEEEHGPLGVKIAVVHTALGAVILKRSNHVLFRRFQDSGGKILDIEKLVRPCVVYPDATALDAIFEEYPATLILAGNAVCTLAGVRNEEVSGKS